MDNKIAIIANYSLEYTTANYFRDVFREHNIDFKMFCPSEQRMVPKEYNIYFYVDDGSHYVIYPNNNVLKILYLIDTHMGFDWDRYLIRFADVVFCAQKNAVISIQEINPNVYWLPLGCDPKVHYKAGCKKKYDVGFVGGVADQKRAVILEEIKKRYPNSYIGKAGKNQIGEIYSSSKIVINTAINNDINMRFFEALCSGALLLTDQISNNGLEDLFAETKKPFCMLYKDVRDLCDKIAYYLEHAQEREEIATRGRAFAQKHTYFERWNTVCNYIKGVPRSRNSLISYYPYNFLFYSKLLFEKLRNT